jgi:hypothetical protein
MTLNPDEFRSFVLLTASFVIWAVSRVAKPRFPPPDLPRTVLSPATMSAGSAVRLPVLPMTENPVEFLSLAFVIASSGTLALAWLPPPVVKSHSIVAVSMRAFSLVRVAWFAATMY